MAEITVEALVEFRKPYADYLEKHRTSASLVHEGMVGIVERIVTRTVSIAARRNDRTASGLPRTRTETLVWVVWERPGGGTWSMHYPLSALKIAK